MPGVKERPPNPNCQISIGACRGAKPQLRAVSYQLMAHSLRKSGAKGLKTSFDVSDGGFRSALPDLHLDSRLRGNGRTGAGIRPRRGLRELVHCRRGGVEV